LINTSISKTQNGQKNHSKKREKSPKKKATFKKSSKKERTGKKELLKIIKIGYLQSLEVLKRRESR